MSATSKMTTANRPRMSVSVELSVVLFAGNGVTVTMGVASAPLVGSAVTVGVCAGIIGGFKGGCAGSALFGEGMVTAGLGRLVPPSGE